MSEKRGEPRTIRSFRDEYAFLSNFHSCSILIEGKFFDSVEHYYQANKASNSADFDLIRSAGTPGEAKRVGRSIDARSDWDLIKSSVMLRGLMAKFTQNEKLMWKLQATGTIPLVESNTWHDNEWGDCQCPGCYGVHGLNMLGKLLMVVRDVVQDK